MNDCPQQKRSVSIAQWREMAQNGAAPGVTITLEGDSMRPLIRRGRDAVTIHPLTTPVRRSDVVLFQNASAQYVVHRVYRLRGGMAQTLGDNCFKPDPWIPLTDIIGLVVRVERNGRVLRLNTACARGMGRAWMTLRPVWNLLRRWRRRATRWLKET